MRFPAEVRPYTRTFLHSRSGNFAYTLSEGSLLNLTGSYSASLRSSLLAMETYILYDDNNNPYQEQRQSSAIFNDIFWGNGYLDLGDATNYTQQVSLASRPLLPGLLDLDRYLDFNFTYQVGYTWLANLMQANLGRSASYNATINAQANIKLKSIFDPFWDYRKESAVDAPAGRIPTVRPRTTEAAR